MSTPTFAETHNLVAFLEKPTEGEGFEQIVDFLNANPIKYALTVNPTLYTSCIEQFWTSTKVKTVKEDVRIQALVDGKKVIVTEASIRSDLRLDDAEGTACLPNDTIFEELVTMGYEKPSQKLTFYKAFFSPKWKFLIHTILQCLSAKTTAWNKFSSTMASAIICLANNQKFNFSKYIFKSMMKNLDGGVKFLMYPRFVQVFVNQQLGDMTHHKRILVNPSHTKKIFANMKREGKGFSKAITPLFDTMMVQATEDLGKGLELPTDTYHTPIITQPSSSKPRKKHKSRRTQRKEIEVPQDESPNEESIPTPSNDPLPNDDTAGKSEEQSAKVAEMEVSTADPVTTVGEVITTTDIEASAVNVEVTKPKAITTAATTITAAVTRPKAKGAVIQEPSETPSLKPIVSSQKPSQPKEKGKAKMVEPERPLKRKEQREEEANIALTADWDNIKAMMDTDYKLAARLQEEDKAELTIEEKSKIQLKSKSFDEVQQAFNKTMDWINSFVAMDSGTVKDRAEVLPKDEDDVTVDATPLSSKSPSIIDYKIHKEGKKNYFHIIRADGNSKIYLTFRQMFKNFNRDDLEDLWKIVKSRFKKTEPVDDMDNLLLRSLKTMFKPQLEDTIWTYQQGLTKVKNWKLYDSCRVYCITMQNIVYYLLVEKTYPLTRNTLHQLWNDVRLQVDYEVEIAYELLRLIKKQLQEGYVAQ
ncbi:hypothetical protein Tco_1212342 [Tanacetum coccineum]